MSDSSFAQMQDSNTVAVRWQNQIVGLDHEVVHAMTAADIDMNMTPVSREMTEGSRIYKRSIVVLLAAAVQKCGLGPVSVEESIGSSFMFRLPMVGGNRAVTDLITDTMRSFIDEKIGIQKRNVLRSELLEYFSERGMFFTVEHVRNTPETFISCYTVDLGDSGRFLCLDHGTIVPHMGLIDKDHFSLDQVTEPYLHFRLYHAAPCAKLGTFSLEPTTEPMLLHAYAIQKKWGIQQKLQTVANINSAIISSRSISLVQLSEAFHDQQVASIATTIGGTLDAPRSSRPRLVLIAGPSSSGKTTFAKRLCVSLETIGIRPIVISVDSYYKAWQDIDERGMQHVDWESLNALNLDLLNDQLLELFDGKEVMVPEYDMKTSMPMSEDKWTKTQLPPGGLIIMEGIHCLNPELTPKIPRAEKYNIMISPLCAIAIDDLNVISSTQVRMLRRMVRDFLFRGRSASSTLQQWPGVVRGERKNIFPNQNHADVVMNSGLVYECNVLKVYAESLLKSITPDEVEFAEARRLLALLNKLVSMPATVVPPQSLLREFIGGSWFYEYGGWYKTA
jgi:uridine kinase